ncbi:MAG: hypothetical protein L0332_02265 [Chloroflexi bacterium]|nr:hypothetical protein [Chloroflexota bacterium]MCI0577535.1 hypothetical protein [Chloroflexota bacterium]MCI0645626.1 hypothetical protein [Chloroflexota bacterium]MCI0725538.1 hypothetical protein [Chloroflexota bacterium]
MNLLDAALVVLVSAVSLALGYLFWRRLRSGQEVGLRPLRGIAALKGQIGRAVENGRTVHVTLGRGSLASTLNPTSVAALAALDYLAADGAASGVPPLVTVGEGTLLPAAQDSLRGAYKAAGRPGDFSTSQAEFIASDEFPFAYAAGVTSESRQANVGSNLLAGRFGAELALITEASVRTNVEQVIASDNPVALGVAAAMTEELLIGEELFAAGAYLQGRPDQIASLQTQDVLRLIVSGLVLLISVIYLFEWLLKLV